MQDPNQRTFEQEPSPFIPEGARQRAAIVNGAFRWLAEVFGTLVQEESNVVSMNDYRREQPENSDDTPKPPIDSNNVIEMASYRVANAFKNNTPEPEPTPTYRQLEVARPMDNDLDIKEIEREVQEALKAEKGKAWFDEEQKEAAA